MESVIQDQILKTPELAPAVTEANRLLESVIGQSSPTVQPETVRAEWSLTRDDRGRPSIGLTLSDPSGAPVTDHFSPDELGQKSLMGARFYRLVGNLLADRTKKHLKRLRELIQDL